MSKFLKIFTILAVLAGVFSTSAVSAAVKPQWVRQGEDVMNRKRIGENYTFKVFHTNDADLTFLKEKRFDPLLTYVRNLYGADPLTMSLDSLGTASDGNVIYRVNFKDETGNAVVYARKVDEYCYFDDFESNEFGFEYYQLYAVSDKNVLPEFDDFVIKDNSNCTAAALSIIPGVGQLYKGDKLKGIGIIATEASLATSAIVSHFRYRDYQKKYDDRVAHYDSWQSKATSWKAARNITLGAFAAVWIFNVIDAAVIPGGSRVLVKKPNEAGLSVAPSSEGAGIALTYRF